jgi:hypothetical protein
MSRTAILSLMIRPIKRIVVVFDFTKKKTGVVGTTPQDEDLQAAIAAQRKLVSSASGTR